MDVSVSFSTLPNHLPEFQRLLNMTELAKTVTGFLAVFYYWIESIVLFFVPVRLKAKDISGELVLVTGAGSGLGRSTALKFAEKGCNLVLWDISTKGNEETAAMIREKGVKAYTYEVDVTSSEAVYEVAAKVKKDAGIVTIVVNNAGIVAGKSILDLEEKSIRKVFDVNVLAHFWVIKAFLPDMLEKDHGHLVTISSLAGLGGSARLTDYCASKFAAHGLMDALQVELHAEGRKNIHTTVICPFFINTGMFNGATTRIFSNLEPDFVAEEVITSVMCNKSLVLIPRFFHILYQLKILMPARSVLALHDATGGTDSMAKFTGRNSKKVQ
ncbi:short-chain dehydrogenase/reductase family 16C member 6-like isoform X1 [Argiope bruennichi]|nr:short-chain dehydrogenase/reductase family 16C member 6-like isoform X1 [Argiope bruennichi]XP_055928961.1 short-chain dehydrogenase/reductase family 16C member 6-like isoform X1 [Argiope bruennichi]XP_055928962.1 short-chain dehydrogenase/reductase family 16C member 6-like isoform X1 [Argiope bruennichi]